MSEADRAIVEALRAELAAIDPPRRCCRRAEALGLAGAFGPRRRALARLAFRLGAPAAKEAPPPAEPPAGVTDALGGATAAAFDWDASPEHCRIAYLRGRFLARGSLSLAAARTHLEFVVPAEEAPVLYERLASVELHATWRVRRTRGVVTWKSTDKVGLFLRRIGAQASLLELEARQVSRAVRGDLNRVINAESANLQRAVLAAARQLEAIDALEADGRLGVQPYTVRLVADARRETPEATFGELAERLAIHRSAVQRALERVEWLVLHPEAGLGRRTARRRGTERRA